MNRPVNELNKKTSQVAKLLLATVLITTASASFAEEVKKQSTDIAYVDSVLKWGAWELDIEPAAGGISAPKTRALNARSSRVTLRTNSVAALAPPASPKSPVTFSPPTVPIVPPVVPVTTPTPPVTPPIGGPTDGLF